MRNTLKYTLNKFSWTNLRNTAAEVPIFTISALSELHPAFFSATAVLCWNEVQGEFEGAGALTQLHLYLWPLRRPTSRTLQFSEETRKHMVSDWFPVSSEILETFWHDWKKSRGFRNHNRKHFCRKNNWDSSRWLKPWVSNVETGWNAAGMPRFLEKILS